MEYEGIVQEQLGAALNDLRQCKIHIFDTLDPNALYQDGEIVAEVQGARIDRGNSLISFQSVRTQGNADRIREIEYQDWVLRCRHECLTQFTLYQGQRCDTAFLGLSISRKLRFREVSAWAAGVNS